MAIATCACRDCFELTYAAPDENTPTLCDECKEATCEMWNAPTEGEYKEDIRNAWQYECQRDDAYDTREYCTSNDPEFCDGTCNN